MQYSVKSECTERVSDSGLKVVERLDLERQSIFSYSRADAEAKMNCIWLISIIRNLY